jgi:hypothetical protein
MHRQLIILHCMTLHKNNLYNYESRISLNLSLVNSLYLLVFFLYISSIKVKPNLFIYIYSHLPILSKFTLLKSKTGIGVGLRSKASTNPWQGLEKNANYILKLH